MNANSIKLALAAISQKITENVDQLTELDQQSGDGDLGVSMKSGFEAAKRFSEESIELDCGRLLNSTADAFNKEAPSSLGTILAFFMKGMARSLKGKKEFELQELADAMQAGISGVMAKAGSKVGEKTVLDSLVPGVEVLAKEAANGKTAFSAAALAAAEGSEATRGMKAVWGRAAYYGEKSIGRLDGGSVVGKIIFEALSEIASVS